MASSPANSPVVLSLGVTFLLAACGGGGGGTEPPPPPPPVTSSCANVQPTVLAVGAHSVADPTTSGGCVVLPAPSSGTAQYLLSVVSGSGLVTPAGVAGPFQVVGGNTAATASFADVQRRPALLVQGGRVESTPLTFERMLRERDRELAQRYPGGRNPAASALRAQAMVAPPTVGTKRTFQVCATLDCTGFVPVTSTARYAGTRAVIFLDDTVSSGADSLQQADLDDLGRTFDLFLHPIDVDAFGAESDIDQNGVVFILLTDQVNALTPDCSNGRILGFFSGGDLIAGAPGSNNTEIFYGFVSAPATATCTAVSRTTATNALKPVLIHEFQHMISFDQHVILRGATGETVWLNEALSHLAEELGGRKIPNIECPGFSSCRSLYTSGDLFNAFDYLSDTEQHFLVAGSNSTGTLEERGAGWLFVRWLIDQFGTDPDGTNITRGLLQTNQVGSANVVAVTGQTFATMVAEWELANYLDDLPGFAPASPRLAYTTWGFRAVFAANAPPNGTAFPQAFPFTPTTVTVPAALTRSGTLRGASGFHVLVNIAAGQSPYPVLLRRNSTGTAIDPTLVPRIGVARVN